MTAPTTPPRTLSKRVLYVAIAALVIGLLALDAVMPAGVADGFLYTGVVVLTLWLPHAKDTWAVAAGCSGALLLGMFLSPAGVLWQALVNRGLALVALWLTAVLINVKRRGHHVLEVALEGLPHVVLVVDRQGIIRLANREVRNVFGYEPAELVGKHMNMLVPPEIRQRHGELRQSFHENPGVRPMGAGRNLHALKNDGTRIPVEIALTPLRLEGSMHVLCTVVDISERRHYEQAIEVQAHELETLVSIISHDLKEPLRAVESFSSLIHDRAADRLENEERDFLRRVMIAGGRMRNLLDDLVALSRARRSGLNDEWTNAATLVDEALARLANKVESSNAKIAVASDLPDLKVDPTWATQAIYNLLSNALKFTQPGIPPDIEVAGYAASNGAHHGVGIVVRDRGPGVSPDHRERIFQMFQRAHGRDVEGTGAGLAIVRAVAERHGGRASFEPRPGGGSEFIITFGPREGVSEEGHLEPETHSD